MKFLGTDFSRKYIIAKIAGVDVTVSFYDSFWKGVHGVEISIGKNGLPVDVESAYPGLVRRMREAALLARMRLGHAIDRMWKGIKKMAKKEPLLLSAILVGMTLLLTAINVTLTVIKLNG